MLRECNPYYQIYKNIREITQEYEAQHPDMRLGITPQLKLFLETGKDRKRENLPQQYEVAALIPSEWAEPSFRDVVVEERFGGSYVQRLKRVSDQSPHYMPLHYVLLFPMGYGGYRWSDRLWNPDGTEAGKINKRDWYRYFLFERATDLDEYLLILSLMRSACFSNIVLMFTPLLISRIWSGFEIIRVTFVARCYTV